MREKDINEYYLATVLQIFSDSADPARFLPPVCRQILTTDSVWFLLLAQNVNKFCQISSSNVPSSDITDSVWNLLPFLHLKFITDSAQNLSLQVWLSGYFTKKLFRKFTSYFRFINENQVVSSFRKDIIRGEISTVIYENKLTLWLPCVSISLTYVSAKYRINLIHISCLLYLYMNREY